VSDDRLLDAEEAAAMLNVPVSWVRQATRSGAIPAIPLGRYWRYRETSLREWLADLETEARGDFKPRRRPIGKG
jgi:excisionase family DNA binding protein